MKLIRKIPQPGYGALAAFCAKHLPSTLVVRLVVRYVGEGYGFWHEIVVNETPPASWWKRWTWKPPLVAWIYRCEIELARPEWMSDIQDVVQKYERETGHEVTIEYWESPTKKEIEAG